MVFDKRCKDLVTMLLPMFPAILDAEVLPPPTMNLDPSKRAGLKHVSVRDLQFGRFNLGCFVTVMVTSDP